MLLRAKSSTRTDLNITPLASLRSSTRIGLEWNGGKLCKDYMGFISISESILEYFLPLFESHDMHQQTINVFEYDLEGRYIPPTSCQDPEKYNDTIFAASLDAQYHYAFKWWGDLSSPIQDRSLLAHYSFLWYSTVVLQHCVDLYSAFLNGQGHLHELPSNVLEMLQWGEDISIASTDGIQNLGVHFEHCNGEVLLETKAGDESLPWANLCWCTITQIHTPAWRRIRGRSVTAGLVSCVWKLSKDMDNTVDRVEVGELVLVSEPDVRESASMSYGL
ncbi:hypothetical protein TREMEDRAFT_61514 [Tremella mesenterica DSM 1558]|uniref:uncharacterized protein n=1 Tax=Tremella mesenterica (strain ATCC 24925 / CBS 8224 / DSM 1558 / NBRC 9311 / NRRL Y-6157 / RJB 2259-6 / UBC 559-6) TaxID=578456 RepID=UPI0003F49540|nr:uncharacterized protein TREMEDRAFT_61514 [Tremella mesenterica DSM 1558]EIW69750.1 hypothetical protein TREMEDRAFT_61514 [Tremella mesenterica DSM 1558]